MAALNDNMAKQILWSYFFSNQDKVVVSLFKGLIKIRLGQLKFLFVELAGPAPY